MDFAMLPPEVNSGRMYAGPGSRPMLAAATAWDGLAAELQSTAASYESAISELSGGPWLGPSSASMAAAAAPYLDWMTTAAAQAEQTATQAKAAAAAYEAAFAMTVPPPVIAANRTLLMTLIATNIFGQNTAAIAATETDYAEMWAQDATGMYGYAGLSAAASTLTSFTLPPPTTNPAGAGSQAAAVAQSSVSSGAQVITALPQALQSLASSTTSAAPASGLGNLLSGILIALSSIDIPIATTSVGSSVTSASSALTATGMNYRGMLINADRDYAQDKGPYTGYGPGAAELPEWFFGGPNALGEASSAPPPSAAAGLGQAATVGRLSVPSTWTVAAPEIRLAAVTLPATSLGAAPEVMAASPGTLFSEMTLANMASRAISGTTTRGCQERTRSISRSRPVSTPTSPSGHGTTMAADIREFAEALVTLGDLRDSGLLTDEEFNNQKERLLAR
jgi:PPE-repeat protein